MTLNAISQDRWNEAWASDLDVLQNLARNGDRPEVSRLVDISFRGSAESLDILTASAANFGFSVQSSDPDEQGQPWLFLVRMQSTDLESMCEFTATYLQIEDVFDVECDGWGCLAHNENGPIFNENPA